MTNILPPGQDDALVSLILGYASTFVPFLNYRVRGRILGASPFVVVYVGHFLHKVTWHRNYSIRAIVASSAH